MVQVAMAKRSKEVLANDKGATDYELKTYKRLVHSVNPTKVQDVLSFLNTVLPAEGEDKESWLITVKDAKDMSVKELRGAIRKAGLERKAVGFMEMSEFVRLVQDYRDGKL